MTSVWVNGCVTWVVMEPSPTEVAAPPSFTNEPFGTLSAPFPTWSPCPAASPATAGAEPGSVKVKAGDDDGTAPRAIAVVQAGTGVGKSAAYLSTVIALALSLPEGQIRTIILAATYVIVMFAVIIQGATISGVIERLQRPATAA